VIATTVDFCRKVAVRPKDCRQNNVCLSQFQKYWLLSVNNSFSYTSKPF